MVSGKYVVLFARRFLIIRNQVEKLQLDKIVWLDKRASLARKVGLMLFISSIAGWVYFLTFLITHKILTGPIAGMLVLFLGLAIGGAFAAAITKVIGGKSSEVKNVVADFTAGGIRIEGWRSLDKKDIQKIKIEKYKNGCIYVVLRTSIGDEIRLSPAIQSQDSSTRRDEYCRLCELIRSLLTKPSGSIW